tara:strand:- start:18065 stop:18430 length:366 start_codon:yes stop_codon:yes gene_type:complete
MEYNPRNLLLSRVKRDKLYIDERRWNNHIKECIINVIYYTIIDYIHVSRKNNNKAMSNLEIDYYLTDEFIETEFPELYLDANREFHENGLILHIFDNFQKIDSPSHRRMMFYFMNILYFDL